MHNWFQVKATYEKMLENGMQKKVTESFLLDSLSFTEAESRAVEELKSYYNRKRMYAYNSKKWIQISKYIFNRDNYTCNYCGQVGGILEVDHIVPFSKGGGDDISNLTTSCRRCNRSKKDMTVEQFTKKYK